MSDLKAFFWPKSIAVIGASPDETKLGGRLLFSLRRRAFPGALYPINPNYTEVQGLPAFGSIDAVPEPVDLALIIVRAELVLGLLEQCHAKGVKGAVIFSSGFAEAGGDHLAMEQAIAAFAKKSGLMVSGPNAEGFFNLRGSVAATFSPTVAYPDGADDPLARKISVIAQSGGVGFAIFNRGMVRHLGFNYVVSTGNEAALETLDFAEYFVEQPETEILLMFVEAFRDGARLARVAARAADLKKPVVVIKVGRSESGRRAAVSHTASLAGSTTAYDAVARKYGLLRADDPDEIGDIAAAFVDGRLAAGRRVGIVTTSGGSGVWLADTAERFGLDVPELGARLQAEINGFIPHYGSALNPVDITAQAVRTGGLFKAIDLLSASDEVDMLVVAGSLVNERAIRDGIDNYARIARSAGKPVLFFAYAVPTAATVELLASVGIHCYTSLNGIGQALKALAEYGAFQRRWQARDKTLAPIQAVDDAPARNALHGGGSAMCEYEVAEALAGYGLSFARGCLVSDPQAAARAAAEIGYPVALKVQAPEIGHKTEAGAVALAIADRAALRAAYERISAAARAAHAGAEIRGVLVQEMCPPGREMIAGIVNDPDFGPLVMVGMGGVHVEAYDDTAFAPAPLTLQEAAAMIARLRGAPILAGVRGEPAADVAALADLLVRLGRFAIDWRDAIAEVDLNPVFVYPAGQGIRVADGLIVKRS